MQFYLEAKSGEPFPLRPRRSPTGRMIDPYRGVIHGWLRADPRLHASVIRERLAADPYHFEGHYERVKVYVGDRRPQILAELGQDDPVGGFHARFATIAGAQAQVDWGDEGTITTPVGELPVYSFHMVLSYSRDPFCRYTTSMDLATFWACHREAFAHFDGVPASIAHDRTKTVVRRHVGRDEAAPLHPEAVAFADTIGSRSVCAHRTDRSPKAPVERMIDITRNHVLAGRTFSSMEKMQAGWDARLPSRRARTHPTHGEVIAVRAG